MAQGSRLSQTARQNLAIASALLLAAHGTHAQSSAAFGGAQPVRVAVVADSPETSDRLEAELSRDENLAILERLQIDLLLREGSLHALSHDPARQTQLGRFLSLDYFVNVRAGTVEIVNAQTGQLAVSKTLHDGDDPAGEARKILDGPLRTKTVRKTGGLGAMRVAVLDFSPGGAVDALCLSTETRTFLDERGLQVLDRALTEQVIREHGLAEQGLEGAPQNLPLLGADAIVCGTVAADGPEPVLELTLLDTHRARVMAAHSFALRRSGNTLPLPVEARAWLLQALHPAEIKPPPVASREQVEALAPFYAGVAKFYAGRYLDATEDFQKAYTADGNFQDARLWEARCYDAAGRELFGHRDQRACRWPAGHPDDASAPSTCRLPIEPAVADRER